MADNQLTENDEDDIVIIEGEEPVQEPVQEDADDSDDDDDDDDGDERLGDSEDDSDEEIARKSRSNVKRQKQRERRQRAKEHADRELALLREQNDALLRRVSAIEGNTLANNVSAIGGSVITPVAHSFQNACSPGNWLRKKASSRIPDAIAICDG